MAILRILIADNHPLVRAGLQSLLQDQREFQIGGFAKTPAELLHATAQMKPELVLVDCSLGRGEALKLIQPLLNVSPESRIVLTSMPASPAYFRSSLACGALGYLSKATEASEFLLALQTVASGRTYANATVAAAQTGLGDTLNGTSLRRSPRQPADLLSQREQQVANLLAQGYTNREIAEQIGVRIKSVETYRRRVNLKLGFGSRAELVRYALETGLLERPVLD